MSDDGYQSPATIGGKIGCAVAAVVGVPLFGFAFLVNALGDCFADEDCHQQNWWLYVFAAVFATLLGLAVRWLTNRFLKSREG